MDWTSKFLTGGCKVFAFHTLDLETRALHQTIGADKSLNSVERHALETWRQLGLPDGLQMDNDAAFCGGFKTPRGFCWFVRFCFFVGVEAVFLPPHQAERDGLIARTHSFLRQNFLWARPFYSSAAGH